MADESFQQREEQFAAHDIRPPRPRLLPREEDETADEVVAIVRVSMVGDEQTSDVVHRDVVLLVGQNVEDGLVEQYVRRFRTRVDRGQRCALMGYKREGVCEMITG